MVRLGRDSEVCIRVRRVERIFCGPEYRLSEDYTDDWHQFRSMAGLQADVGVIEGGMYICIIRVFLALNIMKHERLSSTGAHSTESE